MPHVPRCIAAMLATSLLLGGCDRSGNASGSVPSAGSGAGSGATGSQSASPLMKPFAGAWKFDLEKTLAAWKAQGVSAAEIAQVRAMAKLSRMHPDMTIAGDVATLSPLPLVGEYAFFELHQHNQWVCGKAWHHEDRGDPGDMDKYYTRLELKGADLHLTVRVPEDAADPSDPDVANPWPTGSVASCLADSAPEPAYDPWRTFVFVRANAEERR